MERLLNVKEFHELARIAVSTIYHLASAPFIEVWLTEP